MAAWRGRSGEDAGFGLVEVMIAIVLLLIVLVPSTQLIETTVQQSVTTTDRIAATEMAEQGLEQISNDSMTTLETDLNTNVLLNTTTVAGVTYTVTGYITWLGVGSNPDLCTAGSPPQVMSATATVTWGKSNKLAESTVINPPYGLAVFYLAVGLTKNQANITTLTATTDQTIAEGATLTIGADTADSQTVTVHAADNGSTTIDVNSFTSPFNFPANTTPVALPGEGYLAVQVNGASALGGPPADVGDVTVTVTPVAPAGPAQTFYPDNTGCVYEQELPGTYDIALGTGNVSPPAEPFVDFNQDLAPVSPTWPTNVVTPFVVTANTTMLSTWSFDQSDMATFLPSSTVPVAGGTPVSVSNSKMPNVQWAPVIPAGSGATTANLYPFPTEYTDMWYGDCQDEQPATPNTLQATAGGSAVVFLGGLADLSYEVTKSGNPLPDATAKATMVNDDPTCTNNDTVTLQPTNASGISQTGVVMDSMPVTASLATNPVPDTAIEVADDGKLVTGTGVPANAYVYDAVPGTGFTLSSSPVASQPLTSTATTFYLVGETYNVTVEDPNGDTATSNDLMVNPNGVIQWGTLPAGTFYTYPLTGTALTVPVQ